MRAALVLTVWLAAGAAGAEVVEADGGVIRTLDKMTGALVDFDLAKGQSQVLGRLTVTLDACRYPDDLPTGEAFAHVTITDPEVAAPLFAGWMIASSPALSALDHQRYDVWVLHCDVPETSSDSEGSGG